MARPKEYDYPENMTYNTAKRRYVVRNPLTGKSKTFVDEAQARRLANDLNEHIARERTKAALTEGRVTIATLVAMWINAKSQFQPWKSGTRTNYMAKMKRIARELGDWPVVTTDCMKLEDWISSFCTNADTFNKWRHAFVMLWDFAVSRKVVAANEPRKIEERSTSAVIEANRKKRQPLDLDGFRAIRAVAPEWLKLAMDLSLVTLQARNEICHMQHSHWRNGFVYVIREKTSGASNMAFIRIAITPQLEELQRRARRLDNIASPYLVHRAPGRARREWIDGKPHWSFVNPNYLTNAFAAARDASGHYAHLTPEQQPSFHEIRGLGSRLYKGHAKTEAEQIQRLMAHGDQRTTQIYLQGGAAAVSDEDFHQVSATLDLNSLVS